MSPVRDPQPATITLPVAIQRYFEVALYLLVLTGFGTLASTGGLDVPTVLLVGAVLLFRGYLLATRRTVIIPERWTNILTLAYLALYAAEYLLRSGAFLNTFLNATVHLVLFVMVVRLFSAQRDRDFYFLSVISFLMVLAAAVLTVDSTFLLAFCGFILMAVVTFILMEMRNVSAKATSHSNESNGSSQYRNMAFSLAAAAPAIVLLILLGAAGIFFVLPRVSSGYLSAYSSGGQLTTGFSDSVQLGSIGEIQQSSAVVMHVQIDGDKNGAFDLKWRGVTLSNFDGRTWSTSHEQYIPPRLPDGRFVLWQPDVSKPVWRASRLVHYRVLMEPMRTNVFFLAATPQTLEGNYTQVALDNGGAVFDLDPEHPVSQYKATSNLYRPGVDELRAASGPYPPQVSSVYLQLPPALDARIPRLAQKVAALANNPYDKTVAIETYLQTNFGYTLQLPRTPQRDPLANFLFDRKQGHCEYFASSMAVMLRTLQIPSRVVNGFRTADFNDLTSQYLVRSSNAHSWVEAYFPGYGWMSFDPTPAAPTPAHSGWSRVMMYVDAMASFWREWVVSYDVSHQRTLGQEAARGTRAWFDALRNRCQQHYESLLAMVRHTQAAIERTPVRWSVAGALFTLALLFAINARRLWRAFRRSRVAARPEKSPRQAATIWYERTTRMIARRGWLKSPAQTPGEFVTSIEDAAVRESMAQFTLSYEGARFGDSAEDAQRLPELYEEVSTAARQ
jgi:transglutaminase-like putative cysteine protease